MKKTYLLITTVPISNAPLAVVADLGVIKIVGAGRTTFYVLISGVT